MAGKDDSTPEMVKAVVLRDYWDANENRTTAGTIIELTKDELIDGLTKGTLAKA